MKIQIVHTSVDLLSMVESIPGAMAKRAGVAATF